MPKESNNSRNINSQSSKPYDVSNSSFVRRATSRVFDLLPQPSWLSRWLVPSSEPETTFEIDSLNRGHNQEGVEEFRRITRSDLNAVNNVDEPIPSKRPKLHGSSLFDRPPVTTTQFSPQTGNEELSPIMPQNEASTSKSHPRQFTFSSLPVAPVPNLFKINGDDCSESSESTSGCSSLLPQAQSTINQRMNDMNASGHSRSILPNTNMSLSFYRSSGRRPTFDTATFSSSLRSCMQDRVGGSPFYSGKTMFGGASAGSLSCMASTRRLGPTVRPVEAKNEQVPLSSTAKKILDALEQFSTPILDAKRIPVTIGTKRKIEASTSKRYSELSVPTTTDLLRVKRKERLQKSTSDARQTSLASTYSKPNTPLASEMSKTQDVEYKLRDTDSSQNSHQKSAGKLRTRWKDRSQAKEVKLDDSVTDVRLPDVKLPIKSLPSIDIKISSHSSNDQPHNGSNFLFSTPLQDKTTSSVTLATPTVNFKFIEPVCESDKSVKSDSNSNSNNVMNFNFVSSVRGEKDEVKTKRKKSVSEKSKVLKSATQLEKGSVMDVLAKGKDDNTRVAEDTIKNKVPEELWQCNYCHYENTKDESECLGCGTEKVSQESSQAKKSSSCEEANVSKPKESGFGDKFKKPSGSWECQACLLINRAESTKCVACETVKAADTDSKKSAPAITTGFGNMFKPAAGSWECKSCLVVNKAEINKCAACETVRSSANNVKDTVPATITLPTKSDFGNLFKKPAGSWDCEACMLQNDSEKIKCAACETPKPGVKVSETKTPLTNQFSFGIPKGMEKAAEGFKLGALKSEELSELKKTPTFNFGIPNNVNEDKMVKSTTTTTFQFGLSNQSQQSSAATFSFGIPKKEDNKNLLTNGSDNKSQVNQKESKNETFKTIIPDSKSPKHKAIASDLDESKKSDILMNSKTDSSTPKVSAIFSFGAPKTTINKTVDEQNEKTKSPFQSPVLDKSVTSTAQISTTLSTSSTVTSSSSSNLLKMSSPKTISSSNETKNIPNESQNTLLGFNASNKTLSIESKSGLNVLAKNENKPNLFSSSSETKPVFGGLQPSLTGSAATFYPSTVSMNASNNSFDAKSSNFTPVAGKEQTVTHLASQVTPNIFAGAETRKASVFGTAVTTSSSAATFPAFGMTNTFPNAAVNPTVSENKPSSVFTFGTSANKQTEQPSGFVFNPVVDRHVGGFNFTPEVEQKAPMFSTNVPSFGTVSNAPTPSVFGNPQPAPSFGAVFAFDSGAQPRQSANTVFGFGTQQSSSAPAPTASPAFVFGATPTPAANPTVPSFDPNVRPTFNFTAGAQPSTFTAAPLSTPSTANPVRKIRKAVRRAPK